MAGLHPGAEDFAGLLIGAISTQMRSIFALGAAQLRNANEPRISGTVLFYDLSYSRRLSTVAGHAIARTLSTAVQRVCSAAAVFMTVQCALGILLGCASSSRCQTCCRGKWSSQGLCMYP